MPSEVSEVVEYADVSFQSELSTIRLLDEAAGRAGKRHNVVLMIDLGDLREGIFYEKEEEIFSTVAELLLLKHIRLYGACAKAGAALPHPAPHGLRREFQLHLSD